MYKYGCILSSWALASEIVSAWNRRVEEAHLRVGPTEFPNLTFSLNIVWRTIWWCEKLCAVVPSFTFISYFSWHRSIWETGFGFNGTPTPHLPPTSLHLQLPKDGGSTRKVVVFTSGFENSKMPKSERKELQRRLLLAPHLPYPLLGHRRVIKFHVKVHFMPLTSFTMCKLNEWIFSFKQFILFILSQYINICISSKILLVSQCLVVNMDMHVDSLDFIVSFLLMKLIRL